MKKKSIAIDLFVSILVNKTKTSRKTTWKKKEHTKKTHKGNQQKCKKREAIVRTPSIKVYRGS